MIRQSDILLQKARMRTQSVCNPRSLSKRSVVVLINRISNFPPYRGPKARMQIYSQQQLANREQAKGAR